MILILITSKIICCIFAFLLSGFIVGLEASPPLDLRSTQSPTFPQTRIVHNAPSDQPTPSSLPSQTPRPVIPQELPVQTIPLAGPISSSDSEISGMAWHGDISIFLSQYPEMNQSGLGNLSLFALKKNKSWNLLRAQPPNHSHL